MSDLILRQNALDALKEYEVVESDNFTKTDPISKMTVATIANCIEVIWELPSVEPEERTAKVMKHKYWLGVSLNVVGEQTIGYEWICENCKKMVLDGDDYCSHCGARLEWE